MKPLLNVIIILAVCGAITFASNFEPFRLERLTSQDSPQAKDDKINRNSEKSERRDRSGQEWDNDHYPQYGDISSGEFAWDALGGWYEVVVYLPEKYESSSSYVVSIGRTAPNTATPANQIVLRYSDSSFAVRSDTTGNGIMWMTMGVRKSPE